MKLGNQTNRTTAYKHPENLSVGQNSVKGLDDPINKGIDMVFKFSNPPPRYFICEVKYNNARLNKTITKLVSHPNFRTKSVKQFD